MQIECTYNSAYEKFLKEVVAYVINFCGAELDLSGIEKIELIDSGEFEYETDGKIYNEGRNLIVTSRLYDQLEQLNIKDIENTENFQLIVNTLYHEMGHASDWKKMPRLYGLVEENATSALGLASLFWTEYLAEKRSSEKGLVSYDSFCLDVAQSEWKVYKVDFCKVGTDNFFYLCKVLPYFMGRTIASEKREKYLGIMKNSLVKEFILELDQEIKHLEKEYPFDAPEKLRDLYDIMNKFYKKFKKAFMP